jgi:hypothetical protein
LHQLTEKLRIVFDIRLPELGQAKFVIKTLVTCEQRGGEKKNQRTLSLRYELYDTQRIYISFRTDLIDIKSSFRCLRMFVNVADTQ